MVDALDRTERAGAPEAAVRPRAISPAIPLLIASLVLACAIATQSIAHALHYSPALGHPLLALSETQAWAAKAVAVFVIGVAGAAATWWQSWQPLGPGMGVALLLTLVSLAPIYEPTQAIGWGLRLAQHPAYRGIAIRASLSGVVCGGVLFVGLLLFLPKPAPQEPSGAYGTAKFGDPAELKCGAGPIIGRHDGELVRYNGDGHLITFAPTGAGKGVGAVLPNCLTYPGSLVVSDPKGENAAVTRRARRAHGQQVVWLDPWKVLSSVKGPSGKDSYNPLDFIDPDSPDANDDAWMIAEQIIPAAQTEKDGHWADQARAFLAGLILHVATKHAKEKDLRTLPQVRALLCLPSAELDALLDEMMASKAAAGCVSRAATLLKENRERAPEEFASIKSTLSRFTWFLDSPRIQEVMKASTFDMEALKRGKLSVFISIPQHRLDTYGGWGRVILSSALAATSRIVGKPQHKVLMILDELGNLGPLPEVTRAFTLSRGSGATVWAVFQDVSQPKALYSTRWATFFANADVLQTFGVNDQDTATLLSAMAGEETIVVETANASASRNRGVRGGAGSSSGTSVTAAERGRKLLLPDEVRRLAPTQQLVFLRGKDPLIIDRVVYWREPEFKSIALENPTLRPVVTAQPVNTLPRLSRGVLRRCTVRRKRIPTGMRSAVGGSPAEPSTQAGEPKEGGAE